MFEMFPSIFNNLMGNNQGSNKINNGMLNQNNYNGNMYSGSTDNGNYKYGTFTNGNDIINVFSGAFAGNFAGTFNSIFNDVFSTLINNEGLINSIVETVINSDVMNSLIEEEESEEEIDLEFRDYGDRYLIEGKLEGVNKKDIDVDYDNEHISIKVKRDAIKDNYFKIAMLEEKDYAERSFYVPRVDSKRIQAVFNADVLRIYLKKLPEIEEGTTIIDVEEYNI